MAERELKHLYPTLEMLAEALNLAGFPCRGGAFGGRGGLRPTGPSRRT